MVIRSKKSMIAIDVTESLVFGDSKLDTPNTLEEVEERILNLKMVFDTYTDKKLFLKTHGLEYYTLIVKRDVMHHKYCAKHKIKSMTCILD